MTAIDGHEMAKRGRAGPALATAALGSFFAGTVGTIVLALFAAPLARVALEFGPAEYFSLVVLGLIASIALASGSTLKALAMIVLGLLLGTVGQDIYSGTPRFTFGQRELYGGLNFVSLAVGIFGVAEILRNLETRRRAPSWSRRSRTCGSPWRTSAGSLAPVLRGTGLGSALGVLPGAGHVLASFASYSVEKRVSKHPESSGRARSKASPGRNRPTTPPRRPRSSRCSPWACPRTPIMALMVGAFIIQGITPGPNVINDEPALVWGLIVSMWIGNLFLVLLNLPLIGLWVKMLTIPYRVLFPAIIGFAAIGCYSLGLNAYHVYAIAFFGVLGYFLIKLGCEPAPLLLGFVLGPLLEEYLRRAMIISRGDPSVFLTRPISLTLLILAVVAFVIAVLPAIRRKREVVFEEEI